MKDADMADFADRIADLCLKKYASLKKTGKPSVDEWTVLSGIILKDVDGSLSLVSLATGTKCLGGSELLRMLPSEQGSKLNDSHAEILARRAFLRYLYNQIDLLLSGNVSNVFVLNNEQIEMKEGVSFHFYSSQTPCGDCSIIPVEDNIDDQSAPPPKLRKVATSNQEMDAQSERTKIVKDIHRTGAKCVKTEKMQDPKLPGLDYHIVGLLRTKPGRGDPTLSLSCSDKMAKWNILGIQGSLLSLLIPQIKLASIVISGNCPFSLESMERGLYKRFFETSRPQILQSKLVFPHQKSVSRTRPCPTSIIWSAVKTNEIEIAVDGRKQGATKKKKGTNLSVSRRSLFEMFLKISSKYRGKYRQTTHPKKITYYNYKQWSEEYQNLWKKLKSDKFSAWPSKPIHIQEFII